MKNIVSGMLPATHREQVLGDLQERGYRFRDIVNVLPRVWWSHLVRTLTAPPPRLARATDATIRARTEQLARQGALAFYGRYVTIWALYIPFRHGPPHLESWQVVVACGVAALLAVPGYFMSLRRALRESNSLNPSRPQLLSAYSQQIDYQMTQAKSVLYLPSAIVVLWLFDWYQSGNLPTFLLVALPVTVALASLAVRRISWLRDELDLLFAR